MVGRYGQHEDYQRIQEAKNQPQLKYLKIRSICTGTRLGIAYRNNFQKFQLSI